MVNTYDTLDILVFLSSFTSAEEICSIKFHTRVHVLTSKTVTGEGVVRYIQTLPTLLTVETAQAGGAGVPVPLRVLWTQVHLYGTLGALQPDLDVGFWIRNL